MTKFSSSSVTTQIWATFAGVFALVFVCLLIFHSIFYGQFYGFLKKQELINQSSYIVEVVKKGNYENELDSMRYNENISIAIFYELNDSIQIYYNPDNVTTLQFAYNLITSSTNLYEQYAEETENEDGLIACITYFVYDGVECYIYVNSPMLGSTIAKSINSYQLIIASTASLLIGIVISYFFSKYLSKPIREINDAAYLLATGDFSAQFPIEGYDEIKQLGESLNKAKDELMKTDKLQKEFIANVSHDLRTPLTIIQSYTEMIKDISGENKDKREQHLDIILGEVKRLTSLVTDVLELTKIRANIKELNLEETNISNLVSQVIDKVRLPLMENNIKLTTLFDESIIAKVDQTQFNQVIYNFVLNAITYTKSEIIINIEQMEEYILFEVIDNGDGIKEEDISFIWDRYYRSEENHERHKHGSGLGLSIVKNILENHKFEYGVTSKFGDGARFYIKIPTNNK